MGIESPLHLLFIAVVALLVLGPRRLPKLARAVGQGMREFREAVSGDGAGEATPPCADHAEPPAVARAAPAPVDVAAEDVPASIERVEGAAPVDPAEPVRSGDAPDRRAL
jgi:TatA/E family protein of Tat protein translocase